MSRTRCRKTIILLIISACLLIIVDILNSNMDSVTYAWRRLDWSSDMSEYFEMQRLGLAIGSTKVSKFKKDFVNTSQQFRVDQFCAKYGLIDTGYLNATHTQLDYQLLVNKNAQTMFCYVPKTGCTNLKVAFFMSQGLLQESVLNITAHTIVSHDVLVNAQESSTFAKVFPKFKDKQEALKKYFKYIMYRHPLERIASGYRDKIAHWHKPYKRMRQAIYSYANPDKIYQEVQGKIQISFSDFISYWLDKGLSDEHFVPIFDLCDPCRIRYDYFGQFKNYTKHAAVLLKVIGGKQEFLLQDNYIDQTQRTASLTQELFNEVPDTDKRAVLKKLSQDIDFYYHIYPDEVDTHKEILNLPDELTVPYKTQP